MYDDFPPERIAKEIRSTIADLNQLFKMACTKGVQINIKSNDLLLTQNNVLVIDYIKLIKEF